MSGRATARARPLTAVFREFFPTMCVLCLRERGRVNSLLAPPLDMMYTPTDTGSGLRFGSRSSNFGSASYGGASACDAPFV